MKILIDMNISPQWVQVFQKHGFQSVHWSAVGEPRATDRSIMDWARTNGFIVFTHDLDFGAILAATQAESPSVIQVRTQNVLPTHLEDLLIGVLRFESILEAGALIVVNEARSRARILPLNY